MKAQFPRTIAEELLKQWRGLVRVGDAVELARLLEVSKPTIDKALIYGNCHQERIVEAITKYFLERITKEREAASLLANETK